MISEYAFYLDREPVRISNSPLPPPILTFNPQTKKWTLNQPYEYHAIGCIIKVPQGYQFDLASVPRAVWWAISPFELSIVAPLIHDILYDYAGYLPQDLVIPFRTFTRKDADGLFLEIMRKEGIPEIKCRIAYNAVRAFGGIPWKGNTNELEENNLQFLPV